MQQTRRTHHQLSGRFEGMAREGCRKEEWAQQGSMANNWAKNMAKYLCGCEASIFGLAFAHWRLGPYLK